MFAEGPAHYLCQAIYPVLASEYFSQYMNGEITWAQRKLYATGIVLARGARAVLDSAVPRSGYAHPGCHNPASAPPPLALS